MLIFAATGTKAHAGDVTLEDLHELLIRQQKVIEEQGKKIEELQRELEAVKDTPTAEDRPPAPLPPVPVPAATPEPTAPVIEMQPVEDAEVGQPPAPAPAVDAKAYTSASDRLAHLLERFSVSSYGVVTYSHYDWETDSDLRDDIDFERVVLGVGYRATDTVKLEAEVEIEHLGTGSSAGLADGRPEFGANGREWRTPPLWGVGLSKVVNGHTLLLHDGRARGFLEAILWHGGEAEAAREAVRAMSADDRAALVHFLDSL